MRELALAQITSMLIRKGFLVSSFFHSNNCFDIAARHSSLVLLIKIYSNIDSIRQEQGEELGKLSNALNANALIIGEKTKAFKLKDEVVYERYGIPVLTISSFKKFLEKEMPSVKYFKGRKIVELDAEKLVQKRKNMGLSREELAEKVGAAPESIHRYEKGSASTLETAEKLEGALKTSLIKEVNLFEKKFSGADIFDKQLDEPMLSKVQRLGLDLALFEHAPFKAFSHPTDSLLISIGKGEHEIRHRALKLAKTKGILESHLMILAKESKKKSVESIPVVEEEELESLSKPKDLMKIIKAREKKKDEL
ncbi:MAG: helix-turn-helix domain-containing protein [Candidatus Diapherotrites archaeon]|uniref:Putative HTH-type transcriptional regulatory protein HA237_04040 n=1 Tax=Candidatus Iainarchaeum sp. TaxID=3101447 RepID=A0A7J4IW88_9ARCH|nr:MAG: hypothetical protein QT03_C0001G0187 [archaeon GW2011_AR10]MBS3059454.1 helix-turn-helix domain-containing protein [Candidatus Diapherotrites archaeon]HIH08515.1 helix-turn-helix domain-containing protein [Candidatus Diapherotrites archaeon]